jgi:adenylyltransferase/sulfurtransferase
MANDQEHHPEPLDASLERYSRQILYEKIGEQGQRNLLRSRVVLFGCGALGSVLANTLVRAGVGRIRICDRDYVERNNLQRQALFDESDIEANLPKAEAAAAKLRRINPDVTIEPVVIDVNSTNIERLSEDADLLLDGTDNFEARFLINDLAVSTNRPWVYGAVIGATGLCMPIVPNDTPCLRCVFEEAPPSEMSPTCDTAGVLAAAVNIVASLQATEATKLLTGRRDELSRYLTSIDVWSGRFMNLNVQNAYEKGDCPCCKGRQFEYLAGKHEQMAIALCGRDSVQINRTGTGGIDFAVMADRLGPVAEGGIRQNRFLLKAVVDGYELTLFRDGRAIVKGTSDPDKARSIYARYVGT